MIRFLQKDNATQRILMIVFLGLVCLSMVIFMIPGMSDLGNPKDANVYAKIGDEEITVDQIDRQALQIAQQRIRGDAQQYATLFRASAASDLVSNACLRQEAHRVGLEVTNDELADYLKHGPYGQYFFPKGVFVGEDAYENMVYGYAHISVVDFEKQVKQEILAMKLAAMVSGSVIISPSEAEDQYKSEHTKVKLEYAAFTLADLKQQVNPTEQEMRAYFDSNKLEFQNKIPETRRVNYVVINSTNLPGAPQVSDDEIQKYYADNKSAFAAPEQVQARHILIAVKPGADGKTDDKAWTAARAKAEDILKKLKAGGDFAALAKQYSDDPGSKDKGGELAPFKRGEMVKPFEDAAFSLPIGKISDLVKSDYGYHIIQVESRQAAGTQPLEAVRQSIADELGKDQKQQYMDTFVSKVADDASKNGLEKAAAANSLSVIPSQFFSQDKPLTGLGPEFTHAAFQNAVNAAPVKVKISGGGYAILQVVDKQPARDKTFEEAQAQIQDILKSRQAIELMHKKAEELANRAHALNDLDAAAKELGAQVQTSDELDKTGTLKGIGGLQSIPAVFSMKVGEISGVLSNAAPTAPNQINPGGVTAQFVVKLIDRQEPSADEIHQNLEKTRDTIYQKKSAEQFTLFRAELTEQMEEKGKIKYNDGVRQQIDKGSLKL